MKISLLKFLALLTHQFGEAHVLWVSEGAEGVELDGAVGQKGAVGESAEGQEGVELEQGLQDVEPGCAPSDYDPRDGQRPANAVQGGVHCVLKGVVLAAGDVEHPGAEHRRQTNHGGRQGTTPHYGLKIIKNELFHRTTIFHSNYFGKDNRKSVTVVNSHGYG